MRIIIIGFLLLYSTIGIAKEPNNSKNKRKQESFKSIIKIKKKLK